MAKTSIKSKRVARKKIHAKPNAASRKVGSTHRHGGTTWVVKTRKLTKAGKTVHKKYWHQQARKKLKQGLRGGSYDAPSALVTNQPGSTYRIINGNAYNIQYNGDHRVLSVAMGEAPWQNAGEFMVHFSKHDKIDFTQGDVPDWLPTFQAFQNALTG